jgi:methyl-accepting chemotaxis protein
MFNAVQPPDKMEMLIDQVGRLTEGLTEIRLLIQDQIQQADKALAVAESQAAIAKENSASIQRLTAIVDQQAAVAASNAESVAQLIALLADRAKA